MPLQLTEPRTRHWTLSEYYELAEEGWFRGQRVQLIEGEIIQIAPQGYAHSESLMKISRWLHDVFKGELLVRIQMPLNALEESDPEPDAAIIRRPIDQQRDHPSTALFVIEVADSSLRLDRRKAKIYAGAAVQEYWIVNLTQRCIEIYRNATPDAAGTPSYPPPILANEKDVIFPLAVPTASVKVADLLP